MARHNGETKPRKARTREQLYLKKKSKEAAQRAASVAAAVASRSSNGSSSSTPKGAGPKGKGKGKAKAADAREVPSFHYVSFNDRLAAVHIDVARSQRSNAIAGLDPLPSVGGPTGTGHIAGSSTLDSDPVASSSSLSLFASEDAALANIDLSELSSTAFGTALVTWRELNQSWQFYAFVRRVLPLSNSLPQLLHHAETIIDALCELLGAPSSRPGQDTFQADVEPTRPRAERSAAYLAYAPALDLIQRLAYDLQSEFMPFYPRALAALLRTTQVNKLDTDGIDLYAAEIVEAAFKATASLLRIVGPFVLSDSGANSDGKSSRSDALQETWHTVRPYLGWAEAKHAEGQPTFEDWDGMSIDEDEEAADEDAAEADNELPYAQDDDDDEDEEARSVDGSVAEPTPRHAKQYRRRRVPPHTRRFASEAFAHLVRKAKGGRLAHVAQIMLADAAAMRSRITAHGARFSEEDLTGFESAVAGVWAEVTKSVDDHLHSSVNVYMDALLTSAPDAASDTSYARAYLEARSSVGGMLLTALTHHSSAKQIIPLLEHQLDWVATRLDSTAEQASPSAQQNVRESVSWLATIVGVRKGTRVHDTLKGRLFNLLVRLAVVAARLQEPGVATSDDGRLCHSILGLIAFSLPIGRIQDLIGPGLKIIDALTPSALTDQDAHARQSFIFNSLVLALAEPTLGWSGLRQFVMPAVLKYTTEVAVAFNHSSMITPSLRSALALLARLKALGELVPVVSTATPTPVIGKWRLQVGSTFETLISEWTANSTTAILSDSTEATASRADLLAQLSLVPIFAADQGEQASRAICSLLQSVIRSGGDVILRSYQQDPLNLALVVAAALDALAELLDASSSGSMDGQMRVRISNNIVSALFNPTSPLLIDIVQTCAFNIPAIRALSKVVFATTPSRDGSADMISKLAGSAEIKRLLMSVEDDVRLAACEILASLSAVGDDNDLHAFYERLLEVERTPLTIATVRERNVRLRAAARGVVQALKVIPKGKAAPEPLKQAHSLTIAHIVGSLKLNFRPIWSESIAALVDLAAVRSDEVWQTSFDELDVVQDPIHAVLKSASWTGSTQVAAHDQDEVEDTLERAFKDPVLRGRKTALETIFASCARAAQGTLNLFPVDAKRQQLPKSRLVPVSYHDQVLKLFAEIPRVAERHNPGLVRRFFEVVRFDVDEEQAERDAEADRKNELSNVPERGFLERRAQLCSYLELFGKFNNAKSLFRSDDLHAYFLDLCASGDLQVQQLALACVLTWKDASQTSYADHLKKLLDPTAFRDELMQFNLAPDSNIIQAHHRAGLMPLLVRIFYGQIISRRGKSTAGTSKHSRKHAILSALASCESADLEVLVQLMVRPFQDQLPSFDAASGRFQFSSEPSSASRKRQIGYLSLLSDVLKHLGQLLLPRWPDLLGVTLNLGHHAVRHGDVDAGDGLPKGGRSVRRAVYQRLADFSRRSSDFDWTPFLIPMFDSLINAQAQLLRTEAMQSPTALLELLHTWSGRTDTMMFFSNVNEDIPRHLLACLSTANASGAVISRVLEVFERIISVTVDEEVPEDDCQAKQEALILPYLGDVLTNAGALLVRLQKAKGTSAPLMGRDDILKRTVAMLASLAPLVDRPGDSEMLLKLLMPMLQQGRALDERIKKDLLLIFSNLCLKAPAFQDVESAFFKELYEILASMVGVLRSRPARLALVAAFKQFGTVNPELRQVTTWTEELNSYSAKRLEEPDFDRRLNAFFQISESGLTAATPSTWTPLLYNMIFFVQDAEELALRTNAAAALRQFFGIVANQMDDEEWQKLLLRVALPAIRRVMRSKADLVRREALGLLASAIETLPNVPVLAQMRGLLGEGDGEVNFFNNIVHLQVHRRVRALRRLGDEVEKGVMSGKIVKETFVPLVGLFLDPANTSDQTLINEAITCTGRLAKGLTWYGYQDLVWTLIRSAREHPPNEKVIVRTLMTVLDNFHFDLSAQVSEDKDANQADAADDAGDDGDEPDAAAAVAAQIAQTAKISEAVITRLLPALMSFLESRDEVDDAIRLPVGVGVARLALRLPDHDAKPRIYKLLNVLTGALKSKAQETRDLTREVFLKVARVLGPSWLSAIMDELRRGLTRGPQIAVAAYTCHAVLVQMMDSADGQAVTMIDTQIPSIMAMVSEDLFGLSSEDRDNPEYKSKHREVRSSKSLDTMERLARISAPAYITHVLRPLREVMERTEAQRPLRTVDDALRRVAAGLINNAHVGAQDFLVLCHSLISGNSRFLQGSSKAKATSGKGPATGIDNTDVLQQRKALEAQRADANHYARNAHRFIAFGLDLLLTALKRGRVSFAGVSEQQQQLLPLVKAVGNSLYSAHASIVQLALKATAELVKTPLEKVTESLPAFIKQIVAIIQASGSAQSETVQTAFRTLTTIIRERKDAVFQEKQLADLLRLMEPELEDPGVQWVIFGLLRAIIARRFVVAEVYDVTTKIAEMMVTNQSAAARENCRSIMLQFLLEYPQGKGRLKHQMAFFAKNLSYTYESGRLSVLELLRAMLSKFDERALQQYHELFLVALVMMMANDDSEACRTQAGELLRTIVRQQPSTERQKTITMVHSWAQQTKSSQLSCVALQLYSILLESEVGGEQEWLRKAMEIARTILQDCADDMAALQSSGALQAVGMDYKLPLAALQAVSRLFKADATLLDLARSDCNWPPVETMLSCPQESVRLAAGRLLGAMFAAVEAVENKKLKHESGPLHREHLVKVGRQLAQQLAIHPLSEDLSLQVVKNLLFVGRQMAAGLLTHGDNDGDATANDEAEDDTNDEDGGNEAPTNEDALSNPLAWLFSKVSFQARQAVFSAEQRYDDAHWHAQPSAILRWFAAMTTHLDANVAKAFLPHMLTPIFYITDDSTVRNEQMEELKGLATEVQTLIQEKVGANAFSQAYSKIRQRALTKRRERKTAKLMTTISRPEAAAQRKSKVNARKHDSRKRKGQHQADLKIRNKPLKRHRTAE